jgi:hypothetical protein
LVLLTFSACETAMGKSYLNSCRKRVRGHCTSICDAYGQSFSASLWTGRRQIQCTFELALLRLHALLHSPIALETDVIEKLHGGFGYFFGMLAGHDNHAVAVCHDDIARSDKYPA